MAAPKLVYVVQQELLTGGVIEAQVVAALRAHARVEGQPETRVVFLEPARTAVGERARAVMRALRREWPEGRLTTVPFASRFGRPGAFLAAALAVERLRSSELIFHCRGAHATASADAARRLLGRGRVVFDMRGATPYEAMHRFGCRWLEELTPAARRAYDRGLAADRRAAACADSIFAVSQGLKDYAVELLGVPAERVLVVPSCVERLAFDAGERERVRREWGVDDHSPVLLYSGRLGPERLPEHMLRVFAEVRRLRPGARLVVFAYLNEVRDLGEMLSRTGVPESAVLLESHSRDDAVARSCGADVGVLFLEPALRFEGIQAPIKIAEYLSAGLSLLVNRAVGRVPELVAGRGVGWVLDHDLGGAEARSGVEAMVADLDERREELRRRSLDACARDYLWGAHVPAMRRAYGLSTEGVAYGNETE